MGAYNVLEVRSGDLLLVTCNPVPPASGAGRRRLNRYPHQTSSSWLVWRVSGHPDELKTKSIFKGCRLSSGSQRRPSSSADGVRKLRQAIHPGDGYSKQHLSMLFYTWQLLHPYDLKLPDFQNQLILARIMPKSDTILG